MRGHFPQAHHFLDLASTGLLPDRLDHRSRIGVIHIVRAELLAISADEHYFSLFPKDYDQAQKKVKELLEHNEASKLDELPISFLVLARVLAPIATSSLKKIERAEQELRHAEMLLQGMAHQNIWIVQMELGGAQILIERMLFEIEILFLSWTSLSATQYLQHSGKLEQKILYGMQRLRNVLDTIPFQSETWEDFTKSKKFASSMSLVNIEKNVYKLWRQLYVVGAYYSSLLYCLHDKVVKIEFSSQTSVDQVSIQVFDYLVQRAVNSKYRDRWKYWCVAMRFDNLKSQAMDSFNLVGSGRLETSVSREGEEARILRAKSASLRATVIQAMNRECEDKKITEMWDFRRTDKKSARAIVK